MKKSRAIKNIEKKLKKIFENDSTGHDWWHLDRVRRTAVSIGKKEGADLFIVEAAALLHDVPDPKLTLGEEEGRKTVISWLKAEGASPEDIEEIIRIIDNMSFSKSFGRDARKESVEFRVVQDADRLDAIGAIGIARAFAYGGKKDRALYDPKGKVRTYADTKTYRKGSDSAVHHLMEKGLAINTLLTTPAGKKEGKKRHEFLKDFIDQFLKEWNL